MLMRLIIAGLALPAVLAAQVKQERHVVVSGGDVEVGGQMGMSSETVRKLQAALRDAGCDPGTIDGVVGPRTREAIACVRHLESTSGGGRAVTTAPGTTVFTKMIPGPPGQPPIVSGGAKPTAVGTGIPAVLLPSPPPARPAVPTVNGSVDSTLNGKSLGNPRRP